MYQREKIDCLNVTDLGGREGPKKTWIKTYRNVLKVLNLNVRLFWIRLNGDIRFMKIEDDCKS